MNTCREWGDGFGVMSFRAGIYRSDQVVVSSMMNQDQGDSDERGWLGRDFVLQVRELA